jgi:radical SAM protein with 4Fe4S-binding SPASM domain
MTRAAPYRALWEFTYRCDLRCLHCLVDGGEKAAGELDTGEALGLADELASLGVRAVTLTGGEPLLRADWPAVARRIKERGMIFRLSTNGHLLDRDVLRELVAIGTEQVVVSVDGIEGTHDRLRPSPSGRPSFERVMAALELLRDTPIGRSAITSVSRANLSELPAIHALLKERGVQRWMVQIAHRTGRMAADADSLALPPSDLPALADFIAGASGDPRLAPIAHNSVGYMGAREPVMRGSGRASRLRVWGGCRCGVGTVAIEPDGGIKGCASQVGAPFVVGNVRQERLTAIWDDRARWHWLEPAVERMRGACASCALARFCQAGCTALAFASSNELFDNPYCLRAVEKARGPGDP